MTSATTSTARTSSKLSALSPASLASTPAKKWTTLHPNAENDWINQRDPAFEQFIALGSKDDGRPSFFEIYSQGLLTSRDAWCYNLSESMRKANMRRMIAFYNDQVKKSREAVEEAGKKDKLTAFEEAIDTDSKRIAWSGNLKGDDDLWREALVQRSCRSAWAHTARFSKSEPYFDCVFNERVYQLPQIFPGTSTQHRDRRHRGRCFERVLLACH